MTSPSTGVDVLSPDAIIVGASDADRPAAIDRVGAILVARGFATQAYVAAMHAREAIISTYLGNGIALPHGTGEAQESILGTGLAVVQYPAGVSWGDDRARLVIGLAARSEEHIGILSQLAGVLEDQALCDRLAATTDALEIHRALLSDGGPVAARPSRQLGGAARRTVVIVNPSGLHARPAAEIVERATRFDAEVTIDAGGRQASALSITQVIALGANVGDQVSVSATGDEAEEALAAVLAVLLADGDGR